MNIKLNSIKYECDTCGYCCKLTLEKEFMTTVPLWCANLKVPNWKRII